MLHICTCFTYVAFICITMSEFCEACMMVLIYLTKQVFSLHSLFESALSLTLDWTIYIFLCLNMV